MTGHPPDGRGSTSRDRLAEALAAFGADRAKGAQQVLRALADLHPEAGECLSYLASHFFLHNRQYRQSERPRHGNSKPLDQALWEAEIAAAIDEYAATEVTIQEAAKAVAEAAGFEPKALNELRKNLLKGRASPEAVDYFALCRERIRYGGDPKRKCQSILKRIRRRRAAVARPLDAALDTPGTPDDIPF